MKIYSLITPTPLKRIAGLLVFAGGIGLGLSAEKPTMVVARTEATQIYGWQPAMGEGLAQTIVTELVKTGKFNMLESLALPDLRQEQGLNASGEVAASEGTQKGGWEGADYIFITKVTAFGSKKTGYGVDTSLPTGPDPWVRVLGPRGPEGPGPRGGPSPGPSPGGPGGRPGGGGGARPGEPRPHGDAGTRGALAGGNLFSVPIFAAAFPVPSVQNPFGGGPFIPFPGPGTSFGSKKSETKITIVWRIVDITSRKIIASDTAEGMEKGGSFAIGGFNFGDEQSQDSAMGKATKKAVAIIMSQIRELDLPVPDRTLVIKKQGEENQKKADAQYWKLRSVRGKVVLVDGKEIWVNLGSKNGFAVNDKVKIYRTTEKKNSKGIVMLTKYEVAGTIQLTTVQKDKSMGIYSGAEPVQEDWAAADDQLDINDLESPSNGTPVNP